MDVGCFPPTGGLLCQCSVLHREWSHRQEQRAESVQHKKNEVEISKMEVCKEEKSFQQQGQLAACLVEDLELCISEFRGGSGLVLNLFSGNLELGENTQYASKYLQKAITQGNP